MRKTIYIIIIFVFMFSCIEMFCRFFNIGTIIFDERNIFYRYNDYLGWFPIPNMKATKSDSKGTREYVHNSLGFRDIEHNYRDKDKRRIMFIGDSFCYGYGVSQKNIFVELLREKLNNYEIFNCGISGYGTDQEYILLKEYYELINPDIVFLLLSDTDIFDNVVNNNYNGYYKPYFVIQQNNIVLKGVPVPKSWIYYKNNFFIKHSYFNNFILENIIRLKNPCLSSSDYTIMGNILNEITTFLNLNNCKLIFCIAKDDDFKNIETVLKSNNIFFLNLGNNNVLSEEDLHWNEKGHECVADKIYNFFEEENLIK